MRKKITVCQWAIACSSLRLTSRLKSTGKSVGKFLCDPRGCSNSGECEFSALILAQQLSEAANRTGVGKFSTLYYLGC